MSWGLGLLQQTQVLGLQRMAPQFIPLPSAQLDFTLIFLIFQQF